MLRLRIFGHERASSRTVALDHRHAWHEKVSTTPRAERAERAEREREREKKEKERERDRERERGRVCVCVCFTWQSFKVLIPKLAVR